MNLSEIRELVHVGRPDAPYGARALARCLSISDLRRLARRRLPAAALGYLEGGGEDEWTMHRNREAFGQVELVPRVLRAVSQPATATTVLGTPMPLPFALSPIGAPRMFHHEGELAVARAARRAGLPYGISTLATQPLEAIADEAQGSPLWFQLYLWGDRSAARKLVAQARAAGYRALLLTVDTSVRSNRERELRHGIVLPNPELTLRTVAQRRPSPGLGLALPVVTGPGLPQPVHQRAHLAAAARGDVRRHGGLGGPGLDPPGVGWPHRPEGRAERG